MRTCMPDGETTPPLLASIGEPYSVMTFLRNGYSIDPNLAITGTLNIECDLSIRGEQVTITCMPCWHP